MKKWLSSHSLILREMLQHLDTPMSLAVWLRIENQEWDQLALLKLDPLHYPEGVFSALKYRKDVQAVDLLRKAPLPTTFDRRDAALAAWEDAETACYITNEFLRGLVPIGGFPSRSAGATLAFLGRVKKTLSRWMGPLPDSLDGGFGPGTCVEYRGVSSPTVVDKIWLTPTTTPSCAALFRWHYDQTLWGKVRWAERLGSPGVSRGNRLTTVPKDGKTDRPISIEPVGNLWLQLGIGKHLKSRLRIAGFAAYKPRSRELFPGFECAVEEDAQTVHRNFISKCRREGYSTIDLSSASDTIAYELVKAVTPSPWFALLDDCRSKFTWVPSQDRPPGSWRQLEKFSSMGNGFTFELESLIFGGLLATAFGLTPGVDLHVFGDDLIIPAQHFDEACNLLQLLGFTPNRRKSFHTGPFYESCGGNVHTEVDVTPLRITGEICDVAELYAFHNALVKRGFPRAVLRRVRDMIPRRLQFPGPTWLGDRVLHGLPWKHLVRTMHCVSKIRALRVLPVVSIPLERWGEELAVCALLLGSSTQVTRRFGDTVASSELASVS